jgi:hypothetical protein
MPDAVELLLNAPDEGSLRTAVSYAGGPERAVRLLLDRMYQLQLTGVAYKEILCYVDCYNRIDALARRSR